MVLIKCPTCGVINRQTYIPNGVAVCGGNACLFVLLNGEPHNMKPNAMLSFPKHLQDVVRNEHERILRLLNAWG